MRGKKGEKVMYQNRVSIIGFVGNDARLKSTKNGAAVTVFSVATKSSWKNASGGYDSRTDRHRCVAWGSLSQFAATLDKGAHVQVEGQLRYREYEKDYGTKELPVPIKHRVAEIHLNRILKLDRVVKQDEPAPQVHAAELPTDEPIA
jgi:single-strand DNA-binding protein